LVSGGRWTAPGVPPNGLSSVPTPCSVPSHHGVPVRGSGPPCGVRGPGRGPQELATEVSRRLRQTDGRRDRTCRAALGGSREQPCHAIDGTVDRRGDSRQRRARGAGRSGGADGRGHTVDDPANRSHHARNGASDHRQLGGDLGDRVQGLATWVRGQRRWDARRRVADRCLAAYQLHGAAVAGPREKDASRRGRRRTADRWRVHATSRRTGLRQHALSDPLRCCS